MFLKAGLHDVLRKEGRLGTSLGHAAALEEDIFLAFFSQSNELHPQGSFSPHSTADSDLAINVA